MTNKKSGLGRLKDGLNSLVKNRLIKALLIKIFGSALMGGFIGWFIKFAAEHLYEQLLEPYMRMGFNEMGERYDRIKGKQLAKRLTKAKKEKNGTTYDDTIDDIYSNGN